MNFGIIYGTVYLFVLSCLAFNSLANHEVCVDTAFGKIVGFNNGSVNVFLGIPYAEPPIGRLRFKPTAPKAPWHPKIHYALKFSPECTQSSLFSNNDEGIANDEDCLYINIWQPINAKKTPNKLFPVMIWFYGGAFMHGGSARPEYFGNFLSNQRAIVVSFNYRIGALGFLVSTSDGLFGNYGLADQKAALMWIKHNIIHFNGDPNRITLFGESAGAMSIGLHFLQLHSHASYFINGNNKVQRDSKNTYGSEKLFHSIILQSNPLGYKYRNVDVANFIGNAFKEQLGCEDIKCLQAESADEIIHVQDTLMAIPRSIGDFFTWGPVLTDYSFYREVRLRPQSDVSDIVVLQPIETLERIKASNISILLGTNKHEGNVFVYTAFPSRISKFMFQTLVMSFFRTKGSIVLQMYKPLITRVDDTTFPDFRVVLSQIIGDYLFRCPNQYVARKAAEIGFPVHMYEFSLPTRTPGFTYCDGLACHACEIPFVFNNTDVILRDYLYTSAFPTNLSSNKKRHMLLHEDKSRNIVNENWFPNIFGTSKKQSQQEKEIQSILSVAHQISKYWISFSISGNPNGISSVNDFSSLPLYWPTVFGEQEFSDKLSTKSQLFMDTFQVTQEVPVMHQMIFDNPLKVEIIEEDCICAAWDTLKYKF